jgi:acyl-CoA synthetase (AMP-forming)/AMP-acid ligase II
MVTHRNLADNCGRIMGDFLQSAAEDKGVSWLPLYHDMGLIGFVLAPLFAGRSVIHLDTYAFLKRPSLWFALIDRHRATVTFAPQFAYALAVRRITAADLAKWDLSCLRVAGCGAEPIAPQTLRAFVAHFAAAGLRPEALSPCYGLAEATLVVAYTAAGEQWQSQIVDAERLARHGEALPPVGGGKTFEVVGCGTTIRDHAVRIVDEQGLPLPERRVGEIELRGPSVTAGYYRDPGATRQSYQNGGLRTGDLGYLSAGHLFITGRKKDVIIVHGRNFPPETIEWELNRLPMIRAGNAVAFAYRGEKGTDEIAVVCEAATTDLAGVERAVRARVSEELALTVSDVLVLRSGVLPKTSSGKVQRMRTRALYLDGTLQRVARTGRPTGLARQLSMARLRWQVGMASVRYRIHRIRRARRRNTFRVER